MVLLDSGENPVNECDYKILLFRLLMGKGALQCGELLEVLESQRVQLPKHDTSAK